MKQVTDFVNRNQIKPSKPVINETNIGEFIPPEVLDVLDSTIESLKHAYPSWRAGFKTDDEEIGYKRQLAIAMIENGINTQEKINFGLIEARKDNSKFLPNVGSFIGWCLAMIEEQRNKERMEASTQRILDSRRMIGEQSFEERQSQARSELGNLRNILKGKH